MSTSLTQRRPATLQTTPLTRSGHALAVQVEEAERDGIVAAARIHSGAFATSVALHSAAMLSRTADTAFRISPMGEDAYRAIFAAFGSFAAHEIHGLSFYDGGRY